MYESAHALTGILADVPVHVIPCIEHRFDGSPLITAASAWASIIPAGWSFMLALRSGSRLGVDHASSGQRARGRRVARLPHTVTQAAPFPVAYTIGTDFKAAVRPKAETITSWNTWAADALQHSDIRRAGTSAKDQPGSGSLQVAGLPMT